jgi:RHS repeat-associated protein
VLGASVVCGAPAPRPNTTVYVGRHFEVREHDAPVKYVFNGSTRVARVTGSLSANERIQRLRLRAGWNLVSLAVTAPDFLDQWQEFTSGPVPVIKALYRWQPATSDYGAIASGESVAAGTVLWISAQADAVVAVRGGYVEPSQWGVPVGETFVAVPALEAQPLQLPAGVTVWRYDAPNRRWQVGLPGDLASLSDLPSTLAPGEAIYAHSTEPTDLGVLAPEERIRYYHQDHLGSSSAVTDAAGALIEESAFYPFGIPRHEHRLRQVEEPYTFTQKERDRESGFHYFEARYLTASLSRFAIPDPKYAHPDALAKADFARFLSVPQELNLHAYARNNPLKYVDPSGLEVMVKTTEDRPGHRHTDIKFSGVLLDESSKRLSHDQLQSVISRIAGQVQGDFSGHGDRQSWSTTVHLRIAKSAADIKPSDHVIKLMDFVPPQPDTDPRAIVLGDAERGGKQVRIRSDLVGKRPYADGRASSLEAVVSHEVGHTVGLRHETDAGNPLRDQMGGQNLMRAVDKAPRGTQINVHQIREIQRLNDAGELNR